MRLIRSRSSLCILLISLTISMQAQSGLPEPSPKVVETNLAFPPPVQWVSYNAEISLLHVAWGPTNSPKMLSKGREKKDREQASFYPDRPYVLALGFTAKSMGPISAITSSTSGLVRIKDTDGDIEVPMILTPEGFVSFSGSPGVYDVHFDKNMVTEFWDVFPVAADQKEFLFQVFQGNNRASTPRLSFRIVLHGDAIEIADVSPQVGVSCGDLHNDFVGMVGASAPFEAHLVVQNSTLSGTEQYQRIGTTLQLNGSVDRLGNFVVEERYPEDKVTGIFKGKFSDGCQVMRGYFSKPDGSRLQPFEMRQVHLDGNEQ